ncbi:hypothetical protein SARC_14444, partial [Sphaeroforma arctica JP610]
IDDYTAAEIKAAYTRDMLKSDTDTLRADEALWAKLVEDENKAAVPERIISTAPMGEFIFAQTIRQNQAVSVAMVTRGIQPSGESYCL